MISYKRISYHEAVEFLLPRHYSGRKPIIKMAFGAFKKGRLVACCTYGIPASRPLCVGIMGKEEFSKVIELNRLYVSPEAKDFILSKFVSWTLRSLGGPWCVVSYADTAMGHTGSIYQACNFLYTGATVKRTDKYTEGNKHCRHYNKDAIEVMRKVRSSKHRYVYFVGSRKQIKEMKRKLKYPILLYPKGNKTYYKEGFVLQPEVYKV